MPTVLSKPINTLVLFGAKLPTLMEKARNRHVSNVACRRSESCELDTSTNQLSNMAFITPSIPKPLFTASSRRAYSRATCPTTCRPRPTIVMKKVRRGTIEEDESNAVDVFGGNSQSQDELLAAALGKTSSDTEDGPSINKKKKPKKKGSLEVHEDDNAVDVFGDTNKSQEDLLAEALKEDDTPSKKGKKKKDKKGTVVDTEDNAVDVFGGAEKTQEGPLADVLEEDTSSTNMSKKKSKRKKMKGGAVINDNENAVDVFGSTNASQEELLANALGENAVEPASAKVIPVSNKKKTKGGKGADDSDIEDDSFAEVDRSQESFGDAAKGNGAASTITYDDSSKKVDAHRVVQNDRTIPVAREEEEDFIDKETLEPEGHSTYGPDEAGEISSDSVVAEEEESDDFEPDAEIVAEFEKTAAEFTDFTTGGRRQKARSKRDDRNQTEFRMVDPKRASFGSGGQKYTSVRLEDVTMTFRSTAILNGVTWGVHTGERVGLIGENGCGKTTQLRMIAGLVEPTSGEIARSSPNTKAAFLRQEFVDELDPTRTLREEFRSAFNEECILLKEYEQCERGIAEAGEDMEKLEELLNRMEDLRVQCDQKDAWNLEARIDKVMPGLGFFEDDNDKLVASFSGGWKVRIGLGKVLLQDPDLLLLDEPSNHLDSESVEWLEDYLQTCKLPMVVVSHDREFLDRVCTKIVEIESGEAFEYPGNYSTYVKLRKEQRRAWEAAYEKQQRFIKEQTDYIKRNRRNSARSGQVKSRQKMLERMEKTGKMVRRPPRQGKPLVFRFPPSPRSGRDCILVEELTHGYSGRVLFEDASIAIERGDRIALIGPNGSGKSTLLRLITGREDPQDGSVQCKDLTNIALAYYEQNQADALDLDITVLDTLKEKAPISMKYEEIRALLGKFLFKGDDVEKKVDALSGGEKARLALAKIMLKPSNVLILDEPGNHLSISAKEMLEEALQHFDGTLLLVSHDRYLISQVATQIVAIEDKQLVLYDGDYKSYMEKNQDLMQKLQARFIPGVAEIKNAPKIVVEQPVEAIEKKMKRKKNFGGSGVQSGKTKEMNAKRWNKR